MLKLDTKLLKAISLLFVFSMQKTDEYMTMKDLVESHFQTNRLILDQLFAGGILECKRGKNGGYRLSIDFNEIRLIDIYMSFKNTKDMTKYEQRIWSKIKYTKLKDLL